MDPSQFEVIIVDNGSTDASAHVLAGLVARSPLSIEAVRVDVNRGPAAGRNVGWRIASAPLVAFTDDDCEPGPAWLERGLDAFDEHVGIVVGRTAPRPDELDRLNQPFSRTVRVNRVEYFETCNVFYRRLDLERAGGFDESFRTPAGEDTDLALRLRDTGVAAVFAADAIVHHEVRAGDFRLTLRETARWVDLPRVIARHPRQRFELLHRGVFWKRSHPPVLLAVIGLVLSPRVPVAAALALPWVWHRVRTAPLCPGPRRRWVALPGALVVDAFEVIVMLRGSVRHRTLML